MCWCHPLTHDGILVSPLAQYSGTLDGAPQQTACITSICRASEGSTHRRVECLTVDFVHSLEPDHAISIDRAVDYYSDWRSFYDSVVRLDALKKIVFGFRTRDDFTKLTEFVEHSLPQPRLHLVDRDIVYATWKEKPGSGLLGGTWQYVSTDSDADVRGGSD